MEEGSEAHMETDVSSTTDDAIDTQEVTGSSGQVEMTITVEKLDEGEATSNKQVDSQLKTIQNIPLPPTLQVQEHFPNEEPQSPSIDLKSPKKSNEVSISMHKSPSKTESPQKITITRIVSPLKITVHTSSDNLSGSADSSTKIVSLPSLSEDKSLHIENVSNKDYDIVNNAVETSETIKKSPIKEISLQKSPAKQIEGQIMQQSSEADTKSPVKGKNESPSKITEQKPVSYQVIIKSPAKASGPIKLVRRLPKEFKLNDTTIVEMKSPDSIKPTSSQNEPTAETPDKNDQTTSPILSQNETESSEEIAQIQPSTEELKSTNNIPKCLEVSRDPEISKSADTNTQTCTQGEVTVMEAEASNDSQLSSSVSEKEHNKSISRELKSLINSAKESKIISECTQLTSKTRKSRTQDTSLNAPEVEIPNDKKDVPPNESSDKTLKRSMRSQNPEFVTKCKQFLHSVTAKVTKDSDLETMSEDENDNNSKQKQKTSPKIAQMDTNESAPKRKKVEHVTGARANKLRSDPYCWKCHWALEEDGDEKTVTLPAMHCSVCVRSYHIKCLTIAERKVSPEKHWVCPDCLLILHAESSETRSPAMKKISLGMLCDLLKFALERMMALNGVEPFLQPVDRTEFPDYDKVIVHPMDLSLMRKYIADGHYGSTEAFIADAQWILHNSILFNACEQTFTHCKLTAGARALVRACRAEMAEIETCPECYAGAHSRKLTFFTEVCSTPHMLLWAKLKGFPYWPAKAMTVNPSKEGMVVDVRFFGDHDRAWLNVKDCFLYSEKDPNTVKNKKHELLLSRQEAEVHIRNICRKYGTFVYAPFRISFDPSNMTEQLKLMIPSFDGELKTCKETSKPSPESARRSTSKGSKSSVNDGDTSECEESSTKGQSTLTNAGHTEMGEAAANDQTKDNKDTGTDPKSNENNKTMEVEVPQVTGTPLQEEKPSRKRRRSNLTEVSETVLKKKKLEEKPEEKKLQEKKPQDKKQEEPSIDDKKQMIKTHEEVAELTRKTDEKSTDEVDMSLKLIEEREALRVTPIKLVALPRANKQTPKIFTTAKVTKTPSQSSASAPSTPTTPSTETPTANDDDSTKEKRNRSKVTKADRDIMAKDVCNQKLRANRRNFKNKLLITTLKQEKTEKVYKKPDFKTDGDPSTSKEKPKRKDESDRSLLKKTDSPKQLKEEKGKDENNAKKSRENNVTLAAIARETRNSSSGLPTISNVCSLSTTLQNTNTSNTKVTTTKSSCTKTVHTQLPKSIEITLEGNPKSSIFTPTCPNNVGNMKEAVFKLQKLRHDAEQPLVGRVGVKAFARMTSPDINESVQVEIKPEPIDLDEDDEERQMEKMDLMNACKLQPVNQQPISLRDVRINKVVVTPSVVVKKKPEPRPRAKKSFPQPRKPDDGRSELNGKNSMVYIPIQPPMTQAPLRAARPPASVHGIAMPANITAGPRMSAPLSSTNNTVNTVTTPLLAPGVAAIRPLNSNLSNPPPLIATSNSGPMVATVPTVGPTAVHTVPLMTSVNGQWMFSLQPVMSVGGVEASPSPPMVNGITDRAAATLVPISGSSAPVITPVSNRTVNQVTANQAKDNGALGEMPRLQQRPLLNPLDPETPIGSVPIPSTAGPITARLNQNAVKLTDFFRTILEDSIEKLDEPLAQVSVLKLQLEQARWRHQQAIDELKHNHELTLSELRSSFEKEKLRIMSETRRAAQDEVTAAVKLTKMKQWCSNCFQEAQFYCCWNTSYCDHACQRAHWNVHHTKCTQERAFRQVMQPMDHEPERCDEEDVLTVHRIAHDSRRMLQCEEPIQPEQQIIIQNHRVREMERRRQQIIDTGSIDNDTPESRLKQADNPPKSVPSQTPALTVGGKVAPTRVYTDPTGTHKTSIIVSMVEDGSGNQTLKCLGTYKPPAHAQPTHTSPLLINKQKTNDDSASGAKKVVTSGGYLIVGASGNTTSVITPAAAARRPHIYYT